MQQKHNLLASWPLFLDSVRLAASSKFHTSYNHQSQEMDSSEVSETLMNEWEQVQLPSTHMEPPSPIQSREWEMTVIRDNYLRHDCPVFPPNHHEGLQITSQYETSPSSISSSPSSSSSSFSPLSEEQEPEPEPESNSRMWLASEIGRKLRSRFELFSFVVFRVAYNVRSRVGFFRGGFWSIASASGVMVVMALSLLYVKLQQWRRRRWQLQEDSKNRLILLLREKDEKISQLLLQIAHMNELLSTRRRVPVIRVG